MNRVMHREAQIDRPPSFERGGGNSLFARPLFGRC